MQNVKAAGNKTVDTSDSIVKLRNTRERLLMPSMTVNCYQILHLSFILPYPPHFIHTALSLAFPSAFHSCFLTYSALYSYCHIHYVPLPIPLGFRPPSAFYCYSFSSSSKYIRKLKAKRKRNKKEMAHNHQCTPFFDL